jgi:glycosyltransferase involved in cell wall biosynthesis
LQHPNILHKGFVQPKDFKSILDQSDIYLLPSTFEPWGVSAHEMACAGFPMILSKEVGASEVFLEDGKNGFLFQPTDKEELKRKMKLMASLNDNDLQKMREHSHALGQKITPSTWARQLMRAMGR